MTDCRDVVRERKEEAVFSRGCGAVEVLGCPRIDGQCSPVPQQTRRLVAVGRRTTALTDRQDRRVVHLTR
jgi:hypothetical protein